ncbi:hypothetical protein, partial [Bathymodiolus thermophilus thioautotrophic gill symbiont]|uniref:hypothetical protein n=2 Tax=Bathymodiolus thermophilus thioautotrophic gill symbiont TaxID=2360 RepID=UPI001A7E0B4A
MVILLNLILAGLRLGLKNYQVGKTRILDNHPYLCKGLIVLEFLKVFLNKTTKKRVLFPPSFPSPAWKYMHQQLTTFLSLFKCPAQSFCHIFIFKTNYTFPGRTWERSAKPTQTSLHSHT